MRASLHHSPTVNSQLHNDELATSSDYEKQAGQGGLHMLTAGMTLGQQHKQHPIFQCDSKCEEGGKEIGRASEPTVSLSPSSKPLPVLIIACI